MQEKSLTGIVLTLIVRKSVFFGLLSISINTVVHTGCRNFWSWDMWGLKVSGPCVLKFWFLTGIQMFMQWKKWLDAWGLDEIALLVLHLRWSSLPKEEFQLGWWWKIKEMKKEMTMMTDSEEETHQTNFKDLVYNIIALILPLAMEAEKYIFLLQMQSATIVDCYWSLLTVSDHC